MRFNELFSTERIIDKDEEIIRTYTLISLIFVSVISLSVYYSGGTKTVYPNLMYIPVAIVATVVGVKEVCL